MLACCHGNTARAMPVRGMQVRVLEVGDSNRPKDAGKSAKAPRWKKSGKIDEQTFSKLLERRLGLVFTAEEASRDIPAPSRPRCTEARPRNSRTAPTAQCAELAAFVLPGCALPLLPRNVVVLHRATCQLSISKTPKMRSAFF